MPIRNIEPSAVWSNPDGTLSERAKGWTREVSTPQLVSLANVTATAGGSYTAAEQAMLNQVAALLNELRTALAARGIIR